MLSKNIETALNKQVHIEAESSQIYLSMASWSETHGLEEFQNSCMLNRMKNVSMLKVMKFINERGGHAQVTELKALNYETFQEMFEELYKRCFQCHK
jgi:ferritin